MCESSAKSLIPDRLYFLQKALIYSLIVAGKSAKFADRATHIFLELINSESRQLPFDLIRQMEPSILDAWLRRARTGNYRKITKALTEIVKSDINLETCSPRDLEQIHGVGPKTSRFFIMWIRPNERYAALDTHILAWMREQGYNAPKSTPVAGPIYERLETAFIHEADARGITPRELDYQIWAERSGYDK